MALFDVLGNINPSTVQGQKPTKGRFIKEGYLDWDNPEIAKVDPNNKAIKEVVGVILPPYASYLQERVAAAQAGIPFNIPFYLQVGNHAMGHRNDKEKVYISCQRELVRNNKVGAAYPMLHPDVAKMSDHCEVCATCWENLWPIVQQYQNNKNSPEYKAYKEAHKQLCPQQKYVFNFLPAGSATPVLLEAAKTLGESIVNLHYDDKHPDLLWPYPVGHFACAWVQLKREEKPDTTNYSAAPVYHNLPHVRDAASGAFNERLYLEIIGKMKDLREVSKLYVPEQADITKALLKRDKILTSVGLGIATDRSVADAVNGATAGVNGQIASPPPIMATGMPAAFPVPGATPVPAAIPQPTATLPPAIQSTPALPPATPTMQQPPVAQANVPAMPPSLPATPPPAATPAPVKSPGQTPASGEAFNMLQNLLGEPPK
jgi:hypothetical protein